MLNEFIATYLISTMRKSFDTFSWGSSSFSESKLKKVKISLPYKNGRIDYDFIETYMRAMEKLVLKDVVDWKNK